MYTFKLRKFCICQKIFSTFLKKYKRKKSCKNRKDDAISDR